MTTPERASSVPPRLRAAAQAVLDAAYSLPLKNGQPHLAAALRALAVRINGADAIRRDILAIAAELEDQ